jgi:hypothetical protein
MNKTVLRTARLLPLFFLAATLVAPGQARGVRPHKDDLKAGFLAPPQAAKPRVWWHWMNGNVTKDGIKKDLDWLNRVGIGGIDAIDASIDTPQVVDKRLVYMTPEWKDALLYATQLAGKYGMEFSINSSPGWSETGGPWVTPQAAMKKAVWSATDIEGGKPFHGTLPKPPDNIGPFQNASFSGDPTPLTTGLHFYRDAVVLAYKQPAADAAVEAVRSNAGAVDAALLGDGDLTKGPTLVPKTENGEVWVQVEFETRTRIQGLSLGLIAARALGFATSVEASDDGENWHHVADMPERAQLQRFALVQQTLSFAPATARYFRVVFKPAAPLPGSLRPRAPAAGLIEAAASAPPPRRYQLVELKFHAAATVHEFEKKAQYAVPPRDFYTIPSPQDFAPGSAVDPHSVVLLTNKMKPDGTLDWTPPPGRWTVLRLGYSLTGAENHPATAEATGLEVDKLNATHVRSYIETYLDSYTSFTGAKGLNSLVVDSAEIGMQNWTEDILSEFQRLRGYDPTPFLPVLTGVAVTSPEASDKFLWDFRRTIEELFVRNHFGEIAQVAHERGLFSYAESIEDHRPGFGDDMEMRQYADLPMAAMWTYGEKYPAALTYEADILGAASVAHVYGKPLVAAESLTSAQQAWNFAPRTLKPIIDMEFVRGINRVVIHTSVHQPTDKAPGLSLNNFGQFFNRLESWGAEAKPWVSYMARASYLLQQGRFAADIAYFYGEEAPITSLWGNKRVDDVPQGYGFDFVNLDALQNQLATSNGELVAKSGMHYRILYLGGSSRMMTFAALSRIAELVRQGAVVVGQKPVASPSLADGTDKFDAAAAELFGDGSAHAFGKGRVFPTLDAAFAALDLKPDFAYPGNEARLLFLHRHLKDGELYFVSNREDKALNLETTFRVSGKAPEIWDAVTGKVSPAAFRRADGGTAVTLSLPSYGSAFVVFRKPSKAAAVALRPAAETTVKSIEGPWSIAFESGRGAPAKILQNDLSSWSANADPGVKYFSGTGTYQKTFTMPGKRKGVHYVLDLGQVRELAEVSLNGKKLGTVWTPPFTLDVTRALKPGKNELKVTVANLWVNRLIGDAQPDAKTKYTFTIIPTYRPDAPLRDSGLLGPVSIRRVN